MYGDLLAVDHRLDRQFIALERDDFHIHPARLRPLHSNQELQVIRGEHISQAILYFCPGLGFNHWKTTEQTDKKGNRYHDSYFDSNFFLICFRYDTHIYLLVSTAITATVIGNGGEPMPYKLAWM